MTFHATALIDPAAEVHPSCEIGPYVVIESGVRIGPNCRVAAFVHLIGNTEIAANCRIHTGVVVGDTPQDKAYAGGNSGCRIGEGTTLREGVTIHRGTSPGSTTIIGAGCLIMCNAHVGHNCKLGDNVILVITAPLGGYVDVGYSSIISGNAAVTPASSNWRAQHRGRIGKSDARYPPFHDLCA